MKHRRRRSWEGLAEHLNVFALHAGLYRLLGGRLVGHNILLLSTIGRQSGRRRCTPLYYARDGEDYLIVASNGGEDRYPGWWYNIRSNPRVSLQVGSRHAQCTAAEVREEEAAGLWPRLIAVYGGYRRYRAQTTRPLTMFRLRPRTAVANAAGAEPVAGGGGNRAGGRTWTE